MKKVMILATLTGLLVSCGLANCRWVRVVNLTNQKIKVGAICNHCSNDTHFDVGPYSIYAEPNATTEDYHLDIDGLKRPNKFGLVTPDSQAWPTLKGWSWASCDAFIIKQNNDTNGSFKEFVVTDLDGNVMNPLAS